MKRTKSKINTFIKQNATYIVLGFCILAVMLSITLMLANKPHVNLDDNLEAPPIENPVEPEDKPTEPVVTKVSFIMPVNNTTAINEYSEAMVWNGTLKRYSAHLAIDFFAEDGTEVYAVYDGTVKSVETTLLSGTTITIDHGDGLVTKYNSLADGDEVTVGQKVEKGDVIGHVSSTNRQEYAEGAHLHFEVFENDAVIDPAKYLEFEEK